MGGIKCHNLFMFFYFLDSLFICDKTFKIKKRKKQINKFLLFFSLDSQKLILKIENKILTPNWIICNFVIKVLRKRVRIDLKIPRKKSS